MTDYRWRLPGHGDTRRAGVVPTRIGFDDLAQVIDAAELSGLDGVIASHDPAGFESWVVAGAALRATRHVSVTVEFDPTFGSPVYAAKISATLQRLSRGRLAWQLVIDPDPADAARRGDTLDSRRRYDRAAEFLTVARSVWNREPIGGNGFDGTGAEFDGEYFHVADGGFRGILSGFEFPAVHIAGHSSAAIDLSARLGDVHVFTERPDGIGESLQALRAATRITGRTVSAAVEIPVIARETDAEAWARVERLVAQAGVKRVAADDLADGRWAGFRSVGFDQPVGLVGPYDSVAARLREYEAAGIDTVVLSGRPHIEELYRTGEHLLYRADPAARVLEVSGVTEVSA